MRAPFLFPSPMVPSPMVPQVHPPLLRVNLGLFFKCHYGQLERRRLAGKPFRNHEPTKIWSFVALFLPNLRAFVFSWFFLAFAFAVVLAVAFSPISLRASVSLW